MTEPGGPVESPGTSQTGLWLLPLTPNANSPSAKLSAYLSHRYPTQEHQPYFLDHRLFSDTSSQLPGSDVRQRAFSHILTLSHSPNTSYVCTTKAGNPGEGSLITIPTSSVDNLTNLISSRLQPLWHVRQAVIIENGISVSLKDDEWRICIGDVRVAPKTPGAGTLRGMIIELTHDSNKADESTDESSEEEDQEMFHSVLQQIFKGSGESFNDHKMIIRPTSSRIATVNDRGGASNPDWALAKLYMEVFRNQGSR